MKLFVVFSAILAFAIAGPLLKQDDSAPIITHYDFQNDGSGTYSFSFQTSDGISREESAQLLDPKDPDSPIVVRGSYTYIVNGEVFTVNYVADENGYQIIDGNSNNNANYNGNNNANNNLNNNNLKGKAQRH